MRQSDFNRINAVLDRADFALEQLRKKVDEIKRQRASAKTSEEIVALDLVVSELWQQLQKISSAINAGGLVPHLRLVPDAE